MIKRIALILCSLFITLCFFPTTVRALSYGSGTYTNLCGTGTSATGNTCNQGCNTGSGSCSGTAVVRYQCNGNRTECRDNESGFSGSQSLGNPGCGKTVQLDVFSKTCRGSDGSWKCGNADLKDYMVWYSGDCSQNPTPTPTPKAKAMCDSLTITKGNGDTVPATVSFQGKGTQPDGNIQQYRFHFGDGSELDTALSTTTHTYQSSGDFTATLEVQAVNGTWKTSDACRATVTIKGSTVESHKSACSDLIITEGNNAAAAATVKFTVNGYDNKGALQGFRLDFGNGVTKEGSNHNFEQVYTQPGTFTAKAYIKDAEGNWQGGSDSCQKTVTVTGGTITEQPKTGLPTMFALIGLSTGALSLALLASRKALLLRKVR